MNSSIKIKSKNNIEYKCDKGKFIGKFIVRQVDFVLIADDPDCLSITYARRREIMKAIIDHINGITK